MTQNYELEKLIHTMRFAYQFPGPHFLLLHGNQHHQHRNSYLTQ